MSLTECAEHEAWARDNPNYTVESCCHVGAAWLVLVRSVLCRPWWFIIYRDGRKHRHVELVDRVRLGIRQDPTTMNGPAARESYDRAVGCLLRGEAPPLIYPIQATVNAESADQ